MRKAWYLSVIAHSTIARQALPTTVLEDGPYVCGEGDGFIRCQERTPDAGIACPQYNPGGSALREA
jgi:hypothetical protein